MMTYLGHTSALVQRPCSDQYVTNTARLCDKYIKTYTDYNEQQRSSSPPFSKVALLLAALTLKLFNLCTTHNVQPIFSKVNLAVTELTKKSVHYTNVRPPFFKVDLALAAILNKLVHYTQYLITILQG